MNRFYITNSNNIIIVCITIIFTITAFACNRGDSEIKFDKAKWSEQPDPVFPPPERRRMLKDLTINHKLIGLRYSELINLLGIPDSKDTSSLAYKIVVEYGRDIDPVYTKDLNFTFSKDSLITSFKTREWQK